MSLVRAGFGSAHHARPRCSPLGIFWALASILLTVAPWPANLIPFKTRGLKRQRTQVDRGWWGEGDGSAVNTDLHPPFRNVSPK